MFWFSLSTATFLDLVIFFSGGGGGGGRLEDSIEVQSFKFVVRWKKLALGKNIMYSPLHKGALQSFNMYCSLQILKIFSLVNAVPLDRTSFMFSLSGASQQTKLQ